MATLQHVLPGEHSYTAAFVPNGTFHAGSTSPVRTVTVSDADVSTTTTLEAFAVGRTVTLEATVTSLEGTPEGAIEFRDGDTVLEGTAFYMTNGQVNWEFEHVTAGTHHYTATFVPDPGMFAPSTSSTRTIVIAKTVTTTTLTAESTGDSVTLAATVIAQTGPAGSWGVLEFREGSTLLETYAVWASGEPVVIEVPNVVGGSHTYTATYVSESGDFAASSDNATVVVAKTSTTAGLTASEAGRQVTLTATVASPIGTPAGTVSFLDGDVVVDTAPVSGGSATLVLNGVASGSHTYQAVFAETERYLGSTSAVRTVTLAPSASTTTMTAATGANSVSFDVRVTSPDGVPSGLVAITENGLQKTTAVVEAGRATFTLPSVPTGAHTYVATYDYNAAGDQFAASSSQPVTVQVSNVDPAVDTSTTLTAAATRRTVTLTAGVSSTGGTPVGSVQFAEDGIAFPAVPLVNGAATLTRNAVAAGAHTYTATYVPANPAAFATSSSSTQTVTVQRTVTSTSLSGSVNGSTVTLDIAVTGTDGIVPTGRVRVLSGTTDVGTVELVAGKGTLLLSSVGAGAAVYRAVFDGSADLAGSTSATVELTVAAPPVTPPVTRRSPRRRPVRPRRASPSSTTKLLAPKKAKAGSRPVVKVVVSCGPAAASGKVVITVGKKKTTLSLKAGAATLKLPRLRSGKVRISVRYLGNATTSESSTSWTIKVRG